MATWQPSHPRPSLLRRFRRRARGVTPVLVWAAAVAGVFFLGISMPDTGQFTGLVDSASSTVVAPVDGRLSSLLVTLHQEVEAGQVIARFDDRDVRLKLSQATYELERMRADMTRKSRDLENEARTARVEHGLEASIEQRRLISAVETAQLNALSTRTQLEEARVRVQGVIIEAERLGTLFAQEMVGEPKLVRVRTERDALQKRIAELQKLYEKHQNRIEAAQRRVTEFAPGGITTLSVEAVLAPMRWRLKALAADLERIVLDAKMLVLEAPMSGQVQAVMTQSGEWVPAGKALVSIVDSTPRRILAYVPDTVRNELAATRSLTVMRGDSSPLGITTIQSISPTTVRVPEQLWADPRREEWGYEIVVAATGLERPGERVRLAFKH